MKDDSDFPPLPVQFKPVGGCTCAGPDGPCEACVANEEAYEEWLTEPQISPREAIDYARAAVLADRERRESKAARDVLAERRRQVEVEGWTAEHDDALHDNGELAAAAAAYAIAASDDLHPLSQGDCGYTDMPPLAFPWERDWWKPGEPRRMLEKAGALILAAMEQIDRAELAQSAEQEKP